MTTRTVTKSSQPQSNSLSSSSSILLLKSLMFKLALFVLILSILAFYYINKDESSLNIPSKTINFLAETWSTLSLSTHVIYRKLLTRKPHKDVILDQLLLEESKVKVRKAAKVAIGLGVCTDLVVEALDILDGIDPPKVSKPHDSIENWEQFLETFTYYFQYGAASERYIKSKQVFNKLIQLINDPKIKKKKTIGSNSALMSLRLAKEGIENIFLGAQIAPELTGKIPESIQISGPKIDQDDYHILLEYKTNQQWGQYQSPRANRFIVHSDDNNVKLLSRSSFFEKLPQFQPDILIITNLQMMENSPIDFEIRSRAIENVAKDIEKSRQNNLNFRAHFEMGSFTESRLLDSIVNQIFPHIDSFGMNEQEVANLLNFIKYGNVSYATNPFPRVASVLDEMGELFSLLGMIGNGRVSRIHVHTLAYQVVMVRIDSKTKKPMWSSSKAAMAKASLTAYRYTCNLEEIDLNRANILLDNSFSTTNQNSANAKRITLDQSAVNCWQDDIFNTSNKESKTRVEICLAIGLVCTQVVQTGGAGDNVSAAGMVLQV